MVVVVVNVAVAVDRGEVVNKEAHNKVGNRVVDSASEAEGAAECRCAPVAEIRTEALIIPLK